VRQRAASPERGMSVRSSTQLRPGTYQFEVGEDEPVITVRADDAVVDCTGVELLAPTRGRAAFQGVALRVLNSRNVVVRGLRAVGFHVGVHVLHSEDVVIEGVDVCQMRCARPGGSDVAEGRQWLDVFDKSAWRRYGCGIWVEKSRGGRVVSCVARESQVGITLDKAEEVLVLRNDASRNLGWGIHLDRATACHLVSNDCHGCTHPIEESLAAGVLLNNGCHRNHIHTNDLTRCTHGFIVTAEYNEQSNGNLISHNDASHALTSALEARYCDATEITDNHAHDSRVGVRLLSCRGSIVRGNSAERCTEAGVLVLHGSDGLVERNSLIDNPVGVLLSGANGAIRPPTKWTISGNVLLHNGTGIRIDAGHRTLIEANHASGNGECLSCHEGCYGTEVR
jgi:parallel beta-helix repeat protein